MGTLLVTCIVMYSIWSLYDIRFNLSEFGKCSYTTKRVGVSFSAALFGTLLLAFGSGIFGTLLGITCITSMYFSLVGEI